VKMKIDWRGAKVKSEANAGAAHGLFLAAEHVLEVSRRLAPHEEGTLEKDSETDVDKSVLRASVSYGLGGAAPYAIAQHEEMSWSHAAGRQAKYLEQPINSEEDTVNRIIAKEIKSRLK